MHPSPSPRRLWTRPRRRRRRGRSHGGACKLPLCASHCRGTPSCVSLLFESGQSRSAVRIMPLKPQPLYTTIHTVCIHFVSRPPPPAFNVTETSGAGNLRAQRARLGDLEKYEEPRRTATAQWAFDKSGAIDGTRALIDSLGETNPILHDLLRTAMSEIETAAEGRRLMQRVEYETYMTDVLVKHELMEFYGKGGIPGVTIGSVMLFKLNSQTYTLLLFTSLVRSAKPSARPQSRTSVPSTTSTATRTPSSEPLRFRTRTRRDGATFYKTVVVVNWPTFLPSCSPETSSRNGSAVRALLVLTTRSASASLVPGTIHACSPMPTLPPLPTRCPTTGTPHRAAAAFHCPEPKSKPCP